MSYIFEAIRRPTSSASRCFCRSAANLGWTGFDRSDWLTCCSLSEKNEKQNKKFKSWKLLQPFFKSFISVWSACGRILSFVSTWSQVQVKKIWKIFQKSTRKGNAIQKEDRRRMCIKILKRLTDARDLHSEEGPFRAFMLCIFLRSTEIHALVPNLSDATLITETSAKTRTFSKLWQVDPTFLTYDV